MAQRRQRPEQELRPNLLSGAVGRLVSNLLAGDVGASPWGRQLPHEFLTIGIGGVFFLGIFGLNYLGIVTVPIYAYLIIPVVMGILQLYFLYGELKKRRYLIYSDKLEVRDEFLDKETNTARYENITDIELKRPFVQRIFGTGTVLLNTAGSGVQELRVAYVDNPQQVYDNLSERVNQVGYNRDLHGGGGRARR